MKVILAAINAKYIHSNLAVRYLKSFAKKKLTEEKDILTENGSGCAAVIETVEYTINQQKEEIIADLYRRQPDVLAFSCYIWNMGYVEFLVRDFHRICPHTDIWLGGPEVSYDAPELLNKYPQVTGVMRGEGERVFTDLMMAYSASESRTKEECGDRGICGKGEAFFGFLRDIRGITYRDASGRIRENGPAGIVNMDEIPFVYEDMQELEHKIIYYESSRGCPFACSYCLSSLDRVRFRSTDLVCRELQFFLDRRIPQVKFVDRTFNCRHRHAQTIWKYIRDHDNGITNFHFEIAADLLNEDELELLSGMRPGLVQLEIGVQSANPDTIREIDRVMDLDHLQKIVERIRKGRNIHQHLDLIAGLPMENYESFKNSFDRVYAMKPDQLQLGFLKVLKGSKMSRRSGDYDMVFSEAAPYEVYSTRWLTYEQLLELKAVEEMVEVYYNSAQFSGTIEELSGEETLGTAFNMFYMMAEHYRTHQLNGKKHSRLERFDILRDFIRENLPEEKNGFYEEILIRDLYLRENSKKRPAWAKEHPEYKKIFRDFYIKESQNPEYLSGYENYDSRQIARMTHSEVFTYDISGGGEKGVHLVVFDYKNRDPLSGNAKMIEIPEGFLS